MKKEKEEKVSTAKAIWHAVKKEARKPKFWLYSGLAVLGISGTVYGGILLHKSALVKKENELLRAENEKLGKEINKAWYNNGKLNQRIENFER